MTALGLYRRNPWVLTLALAIVLVLLPEMGLTNNFQRQIILVTILVLIVSGLNLSLGFAGELALGQVFFFAAGAYVSGIMGHHGVTTIVVQLLASAGVAVVAGLITGVPGLRLGSWSLAMTSFFLVLVITTVLTIFSSQTGGEQGLTGIGTPTLFGHLLATGSYFVVVTVVALLWLLVYRNLVTSRHGTGFRVLRQSPVLASSLGISVYRMKLTAYAVGALPAGLAGCFFANLDHFLTPHTFGFGEAILILAASIIGGQTSVYGAVLGAAILQEATYYSSSIAKYQVLAYGALLLIFGVLLNQGITGLLQKLVARFDRITGLARTPIPQGPAPPIEAIPGVELVVEGVGKSFGGNRALDDVSLSARPGQVTALIGPNGSGKTTLLNMICGYYRLDEGVVRIGGVERPRNARSHDVARAGVARTFQTSNIPKGITVVETIRSGRYTTDRSPMVSAILRLPGFLRVRRRDTAEAVRVLRQVGLEHLADQEAVSLPLGTRRLLELARALVRQPGVLLLDEVASGLDEQELDHLAGLIRAIRAAGGTIVLVEHNFRLVLSLADVIFVLAEGSVIATGTPAEIERDPRVLAEYLGVKEESATSALRQALISENPS